MESKNYFFIIILMYSEFELPIIKLKEDVGIIMCTCSMFHAQSLLSNIFSWKLLYVARLANC